jgi:hypothetical protein
VYLSFTRIIPPRRCTVYGAQNMLPHSCSPAHSVPLDKLRTLGSTSRRRTCLHWTTWWRVWLPVIVPVQYRREALVDPQCSVIHIISTCAAHSIEDNVSPSVLMTLWLRISSLSHSPGNCRGFGPVHDPPSMILIFAQDTKCCVPSYQSLVAVWSEIASARRR